MAMFEFTIGITVYAVIVTIILAFITGRISKNKKIRKKVNVE